MPFTLADLPMLGDLEGLDAAARHRRYPAGQVLCTAGDPVDQLVVLLEGRVKAARSGADGREVTLSTAEAPFADKAALLAGAAHRATLTALTAVEVAYLPRALVLDLIAGRPEVAARLLATLARTVCDLDERLGDMVLLDVPARVAKWLVRHAAEGRAPLHAGQSGLAAEIGASRVGVNRALKSFERRGLVEVLSGEVRLCAQDEPARRAHLA